jgi:hypothetical protein
MTSGLKVQVKNILFHRLIDEEQEKGRRFVIYNPSAAARKAMVLCTANEPIELVEIYSGPLFTEW